VAAVLAHKGCWKFSGIFWPVEFALLSCLMSESFQYLIHLIRFKVSDFYVMLKDVSFIISNVSVLYFFLKYWFKNLVWNMEKSIPLMKINITLFCSCGNCISLLRQCLQNQKGEWSDIFILGQSIIKTGWLQIHCRAFYPLWMSVFNMIN
jgi:hypothetical protein